MLDEMPNYEYQPSRIILAKLLSDENSGDQFSLEFINGEYVASREIVIEEYLTPGEYVMTIEVYWQQEVKDKTCVVSFFTDHLPSDVETHETDVLDIQKRVIKQLALNKP